MSHPCVLVVADPERIAELVATLSEPLPSGRIDVLISSGGDDTLDLFEARKPAVIVVTATLDAGDCKSLIDALRASAPRAEVSIVVVGDDAHTGPIRTALDAMDLEPDRFVNRPLSSKALRYAVTSALDAVALVRRTTPDAVHHTSPGLTAEPARAPASPLGSTLVGIAAVSASTPAPIPVDDEPTASTRATLRARWSTLADSIVETIESDGAEDERPAAPVPEAPPLSPPPVTIHPRRAAPEQAPMAAWTPGTTAELDGEWPHEDSAAHEAAAPLREPTLIIRDDPSLRLDPTAHTGELARPDARRPGDQTVLRADTRRPTEPPALRGLPPPAHARVETEDRWPVEPVAPAPSGGILTSAVGRAAGNAPARRAVRETGEPPPAPPALARTSTLDGLGAEAPEAPDAPDAMDSIIIAERGLDEDWSAPQALPQLSERDSRRDIHPASVDELGLDDFDDDLVLGHDPGGGSDLSALRDIPNSAIHLAPQARPAERPSAPVIDRLAPLERPAAPAPNLDRPDAPSRGPDERIGGRDFARQLRAKMSQMAQRLFQGADDAPAPTAADHAPRHDHHTEIDLASLGEEQALGPHGVTEIEVRHARVEEVRPPTSPGSWDTHVRERGMPDAGEIIRGVTDAAMLLAKLFAQRSTGRASFRKGDVEKVVYFDQGRPVFASSNATIDRMGELLVREGKITAAQYERCQTHVAESGRRMGEILVDFGYLKRRELLPAVRRHVEDIIYSLFGWGSGVYHVTVDAVPSVERIRLSRHPASLILEGIRRKLDRTSLEKLVGSATTVIELGDRERLGGIVNLGDLATEERAALAAFDGQGDLTAVARTAGIDVADVLPLAWGLCVLGLATARRTETEVPDESGALVGETDLAIDRERVRARWQLVTEADYFALLGVRRDATGFEIRRAYQGARRDFAADCFPTDLRRELAQELEDIAHVLDEAFRVLRDDRLRLTYLHNLVE